MRTAIRKLYISVLVTVLCLITVGATTYAWIGILTNSTFDNFDLNVNSSNLKEYGVEISLDGVNFSTEISSIELKRQILLNTGYDESQLYNDDVTENYFNMFNLEQCTVKVDYDNNTFSDFQNLNGRITKNIFKFDIYISALKIYESGQQSNYVLDTYLRGNILEGTNGSQVLINKFTYPSNVNDLGGNILGNTTIEKARVNSASASRIAIQKYEVVEKGKPELYNQNSKVTDIIIYQGGTQNPTYDSSNNIYSFGGILDTPYNLAAFNYNALHGYKDGIVPSWAIERGKKELEICEENSQIIDSSKEEEQVTIDKMMKLTFYFWFEGWDADCFEVINKKPVSINLIFSTSYRDE